MTSKLTDPTRGRKKKRTRAEIAEERAANYNPTSEWVDLYGTSLHLGFGVRGYEKVRHLQRDRELPPARRNRRGWEWMRADLSLMQEMKRLGLWQEYWQDLRKAKGEHAAWVAMQRLLVQEKARLESEADEALRLVHEERAQRRAKAEATRKAVKQGGPF